MALHARPDIVLETGVAHGVTSRIVLEVLGQNDLGHLWSIDLPFPFDHRLHEETGAVVTDARRSHWSYLEGSSEQRLLPLVAEVGHVDMFIHGSLHTAENTLVEMEQAASSMSAGGGHAGGRHRLTPGFRDPCQAASWIPDHRLSSGGQGRDVRHRGQTPPVPEVVSKTSCADRHGDRGARLLCLGPRQGTAPRAGRTPL